MKLSQVLLSSHNSCINTFLHNCRSTAGGTFGYKEVLQASDVEIQVRTRSLIIVTLPGNRLAKDLRQLISLYLQEIFCPCFVLPCNVQK